MPKAAVEPVAPSLEEPSMAESKEIEDQIEAATTYVHPTETPEEKCIANRKDFTILVGRVISRNYQTVKYEESVVFSLDGGTAEQKREKYEKVRDSIISRVCGTADLIAQGEKI